MNTSAATTESKGDSASPRAFLRRALGFWRGQQRGTAWFWSVAALLVVFANLAVNVGYNRWNKWFFDALERKDTDTLVSATFVVLVLVVVGARIRSLCRLKTGGIRPCRAANASAWPSRGSCWTNLM
jgi:putative ATP-binding cassette transporter